MKLSLNQQLIRKAFEDMPMGKYEHVAIYLTGSNKRRKFIEYNLPVLVRKNVLIRERDGRAGYVYKLRGSGGIKKEKIRHDLISAEALLRFKVCREGVWYGERFFKQARVYPIPEWAVLYQDQLGNSYLYNFEFSTANNVKRTDLMRKKVNQYVSSYAHFKDFFHAEPFTVLVIEAPKSQVEVFAKEHDYGQFYFTDLGSFTAVKRGEQLDAPIYVWGGDGRYCSIYE